MRRWSMREMGEMSREPPRRFGQAAAAGLLECTSPATREQLDNSMRTFRRRLERYQGELQTPTPAASSPSAAAGDR